VCVCDILTADVAAAAAATVSCVSVLW